MRLLLLFTVLLGFAAPACAEAETIANGSGLPADMVHIEFSRPVTIVTPDPHFPHYHPAEASRSVWFFGWKLLAGDEITIEWAPSSAEIVGAYWIPWQAALPVNPPGILDTFEDGDLESNLGSEWIAQPSCGGERIELSCSAVAGDGFVQAPIGEGETISVTIDLSPLDVSAFEGLYVRASAPEPVALSIELMARDPACSSGYRFANSRESAEAIAEPIAFRFPFSAFDCEPGACPEDDELRLVRRLIHIALFATSSNVSALRIYEIAFYTFDEGL